MAVERASLKLRIEDLDHPDAPEKLVELIEGELVKLTPPTPRHNRIAYKFHRLFGDFFEQHPGLDFGGDNDGFVVERNPDSYLQPDASLFRMRPGSDKWPRCFGPELVVEVMSPSNSASEMVFKRHRFFAAGTEQFWLVYPEQRLVEIYLQDGRVLTVSDNAIVEGEGIAAGLLINLGEVFKEHSERSFRH